MPPPATEEGLEEIGSSLQGPVGASLRAPARASSAPTRLRTSSPGSCSVSRRAAARRPPMARTPARRTRWRTRERLGAARAQAARGQIEPGPVLGERVEQLIDAAAPGQRGDRDDRRARGRRASAAPRADRRRLRSATRPRSALVTTSTSGISMIPALRNCRTSPEPGWTTTTTGVGEVGDLGLGLADADGLDHDDVERDRERRGGRVGRGREAPETIAGGHRADENGAVGGVMRRCARGRRAATLRCAWSLGRPRARRPNAREPASRRRAGK